MYGKLQKKLALASLGLVQQDEDKTEIFRRQREFFYGKSWDPVTESFKEIHGAVDGAIDGISFAA